MWVLANPALSHELRTLPGTTNRVVHIPHNYRHADLLRCVSGITMGGQVAPDRFCHPIGLT